jgi:hypothetical protein
MEATLRCKHGLVKLTCAYCSPSQQGLGHSPRTSETHLGTKPATAAGSGTGQLSQELLNQYVPQIRKKLVRTAGENGLIYYGDIMNEFGGRGYIGHVLDEVNRREHAAGRPLLSAIVVQKDTGEPGPGFWSLVSELFPNSSRAGFWRAERDKVWAFDWPQD